MAKQLPREFGPYTLHELIARGGMAEVYRATMPGIGGFEKPVAIKMILPHLAENEDFITMLIDEARIIVSVSHANIAQVYDLGRIEENYYIAMEFVHGVDLAGLLKSLDEAGVSIPIDHAVYIALCICAGLHVAHAKADEEGRPLKIVHRDVSPHNVLLSYAGEVKVIDFGVAKARNKEAHTKAGVIKGKLLYMAPEQAMAQEIDGRADLFAAGLILYRMLTGIVPFDGDNEFQIYNNLMSKDVTPPRVLNPAVPDELSRIVMKMLERDADHRFQDGYTIKSALERVLHQIAPGYTNSRLSRYIEKIVNEEDFAADSSTRARQESGGHPFGPSDTPAFNSPGTGQRPLGADELDTVNAATDLAQQERLRAQFRAQQSGTGSGFQQLGGVGSTPSSPPPFQPGSRSITDGQSNPGSESAQAMTGSALDPGSGQPHTNAPSSGMPPLPGTPQRASSPAMATGKFDASSTSLPSRKKSNLLPIVGIVVMLFVIGGLLAYGVMKDDETPSDQTERDSSSSLAKGVSPVGSAADGSENGTLDERVGEEDPEAEEMAVVEPDLRETEAEEEVSIRINSEPAGAIVTLDGVELGKTPFMMRTYPTDELSEIELSLDDHKPHRMSLVFDESFEKMVELKSEGRSTPKPRRSSERSKKTRKDSKTLKIPILGESEPQDAKPKKKKSSGGKTVKKKAPEREDDIIDPFDL